MLIAQDNRPGALTLWPALRVTRKYRGRDNITCNTKSNDYGLCQGTWVTPNFCQELTHVCVNRSQNREWGDKNLTHYGESSHKECCPICIHPYKQGQTTREDSKHSCIHRRVLAMGMQTHQWYSKHWGKISRGKGHTLALCITLKSKLI